MAAFHAIRRRALAPLLAAAIAPIGVPGALIPVGPGASESSIRQAVRTPAGRVYIVAADDLGLNDDNGGRLRVYRARTTGIPNGFDESDAAAAPSSSGASTITGGDARLDHHGLIHVVYYVTGTRQVHQRTFSTVTDRWGADEVVTTLDSSGVAGLGTLPPPETPCTSIAATMAAGRWTSRSRPRAPT